MTKDPVLLVRQFGKRLDELAELIRRRKELWEASISRFGFQMTYPSPAERDVRKPYPISEKCRDQIFTLVEADLLEQIKQLDAELVLNGISN